MGMVGWLWLLEQLGFVVWVGSVVGLDFFDQDFLPPALSKDRSESVSVNRANFVDQGEKGGFDLQSVCRNLNSSFDNYLEEGVLPY